MPHISLNLYQGKKKEDIEIMTKRLQECLTGEPWGWKAADFSISVEEFAPDNFIPGVKEKTKNDELIVPSAYITK